MTKGMRADPASQTQAAPATPRLRSSASGGSTPGTLASAATRSTACSRPEITPMSATGMMD